MSKLAINGAAPVRQQGYPAWPEHGPREVELVTQVVESGVWGGNPVPQPMAATFVGQFAAYQGAKHGVLLANGSLTLEVALKALGIGWGDEVIVPALTFEATYYAAVAVGALPVFVDVTEDTATVDLDAFEAAITSRTKAIIPVHLGQHMADMDRLMVIAKRHSLAVVEDCAHAHGQRWRDQGAGAIGDFGSFSHQSSKTLTAGEGGTLLTNDEHLNQLATSLIDCGRAMDPDEKEFTFGANYRIGELNAALLVAQLERFEAQRVAMEDAARYLEQQASRLTGVVLMPPDERITRRGSYQYLFRIDPEAFAGASNERVCDALDAEGVPCWPGYPAANDSKLFQVRLSRLPVAVECADRLDQSKMHFPVAERLSRTELIHLEHAVFRAGSGGVDDLVEAIAKVQSNAAELGT